MRFYKTIALVSIERGGVCDWLRPRYFTAALVRSEPVYADTVQDDIYEAAANTTQLGTNRGACDRLASTHYIGY